MKKFFSLILALLMVSSMIVACTDNPVDVEDPKDVVENVDPSDDDPSADDPEDIVDDEPEEEIPENVIPEKVLKYTITSNGTTLSKALSLAVEAFDVPAGSTFEYDVLIADDICGVGNLELKYGDGMHLSLDNNSSITDNANIAISTADGDLGDYAFNKWYHREIKLYDAGVDSRDIVGLRFGTNGLTQGCTYVCYYDNIRIKDAQGNIVKEFSDEEIASMEFKNFGNIVCAFEVVDDPEPRMKRKTAEDHHAVSRTSVGTVSDGSVVDLEIDMDNTFDFDGVYFGAEQPSYIEAVNSYIIYKYDGSLYLYHVTDKITLASSVSVVNTVKGLVLRCKYEDSLLNIYACDNTNGDNPKLIWSVPVEVEPDAEFGKLSVSGFGFAIANREVTAEDQAEVDKITVYDPDTMLAYNLNCSTDKSPVEYALGENMVFDIKAYFNGEQIVVPKLRWKIESDDGSSVNGLAAFNSGLVKVITECNVPGFVYIEARAAGFYGKEDKACLTLWGGAGADVTNIEAVASKPDDFDAYWQGKMDELKQIEPVLLESVEVENEEYNIYYVKVDAGKYGPVTGKVAYPKNAEPGSLKIKLGFMGYGVGDAGLMLEPGYITFGVNSHSIENGQDSLYYSALSSGELSWYGFNNTENSDRETVYFLGMIMRDVQAVRYMMTSEYWNGVDVELEGGSQGGFQSVVTGALVSDYATKISAWAPAFCDWAGQASVRSASIFPFPDYLDPLAYYETTNFASMIKCPVYLVEGLGDVVCRPAGIAMLYEVIPTQKSITWVQNMTHGLQADYCLTYEYTAN